MEEHDYLVYISMELGFEIYHTGAILQYETKTRILYKVARQRETLRHPGTCMCGLRHYSTTPEKCDLIQLPLGE